MISSTTNTQEFLSKYRRAVRLYFEKHGLPINQSAQFYTSECCDSGLGLANQIPEAAPPAGEVMDRGGGLPDKAKLPKIKTVTHSGGKLAKASVYSDAGSHTARMEDVEMK
jgi:hypothetical protein